MNAPLYAAITEWQDKTFTKATPLSCVNHLQEEVKELKESIESGQVDKVEIADCFMLLIGVCNRLHMSYGEVINLIDDKFQVNKRRQWGEVNEHGYVKHVD